MELTREQLENRGQSYVKDQYLFSYSVAKGAVVANAAYVLSALLLSPTKNIAQFPLWLASLAAVVVTYITMFRGVLILNYAATWIDTVLPVLLAIIEFLLFSILQPHSQGKPPLSYWYLVFACHGLVAHVIIRARKRQLSKSHYAEDLHPLVEQFDHWLRRDMIGSGSSTLVWFCIWVILAIVVSPDASLIFRYHTYVLGSLALITMVGVVASAERDRKWIFDFLTRRSATVPAPISSPEETSMPNHVTDKQYKEEFTGDVVDRDGRGTHALAMALEIRKFEIDLYWKRAAYFWAFIAVAFAGYFAVLKLEGRPDPVGAYVINCLGLVFSVAWFFANRGSKFWQENWEHHVDRLEDAVSGPLYKTVLDRKQYSFWSLTGPFGFSVSRINTLLSLYVILIWIFLAARSVPAVVGWKEPSAKVNIFVLSGLTVAAIVILYVFGQTRGSSNDVKFVRRGPQGSRPPDNQGETLPPEIPKPTT